MNIPMNRVEDFVSSRFEAGKPASLPFSFVYGGRSSGDLLPGWKITRRTASVGRDMAERVLTCFDPGSGLRVVCTVRQYRDFPAVEWVVHLTNTGKSRHSHHRADPSAGCQHRRVGPGRPSRFHHSLGEKQLGQELHACRGCARPAEARAARAGAGWRAVRRNGRMPYFNLAWPGGGIAAAVGWSGQWEADFAFDGSGDSASGLASKLTHLKLHPGETIRTPRILSCSGMAPTRFAQTICSARR